MQITPGSTVRLVAAVLFPVLLMTGSAVGQGEESSLAAAQTRLRHTQEELDRARAEVKAQEKRLKKAEDALARQQQSLDEQKAKADKARNDLAEAKVRGEHAQQAHDEASALIRRFYQERQQGAPAAKPN